MPRTLTEVYEHYQAMIVLPEHVDKTKQDYADELGVSVTTIYSWDRRLDWRSVNERRRSAYSEVVATVDAALLRRALKGDAEAIKLFYARFDGYIPVSGVFDLTKEKDDQLRRRADEIKVELLRERDGPDQPGAGEARA